MRLKQERDASEHVVEEQEKRLDALRDEVKRLRTENERLRHAADVS